AHLSGGESPVQARTGFAMKGEITVGACRWSRSGGETPAGGRDQSSGNLPGKIQYQEEEHGCSYGAGSS
ncbi:MAG: hypothetical protein ACOC7U_01340, partial [Spirochaetota bacterium]